MDANDGLSACTQCYKEQLHLITNGRPIYINASSGKQAPAIGIETNIYGNPSTQWLKHMTSE